MLTTAPQAVGIEPLVFGPEATRQYALFRDLPGWDPAPFSREGEDPHGPVLLPLLVQRASGELVIGCATDYPDDLDPHPTLAGLAQVADWFGTDFPSLADVPIRRTWAGMLPFTSDQAPVIDEVMPGLFVGAGHVVRQHRWAGHRPRPQSAHRRRDAGLRCLGMPLWPPAGPDRRRRSDPLVRRTR